MALTQFGLAPALITELLSRDNPSDPHYMLKTTLARIQPMAGEIKKAIESGHQLPPWADYKLSLASRAIQTAHSTLYDSGEDRHNGSSSLPVMQRRFLTKLRKMAH